MDKSAGIRYTFTDDVHCGQRFAVLARRLRSGNTDGSVAGARVLRDLDLFHDTAEALAATGDADRQLLQEAGYTVKVVRSQDTFIYFSTKAAFAVRGHN